MKEQDAAHSFTEGMDIPKVEHPDFPQWIKSRPGLDCMKWPVGDEVYLFNRLFWAFDAGRNCVWDQYTEQKAELTRLRSELQQAKEENEELKQRLDKDFDLIDLRDQLAKQKEINAELVSYLERVMSRPIFKEHFDTRQTKFLIQKSKS